MDYQDPDYQKNLFVIRCVAGQVLNENEGLARDHKSSLEQQVHPNPQTPNPNIRTPNPGPQTRTFEPQTRKPKSQTHNPNLQTPNPKPDTQVMAAAEHLDSFRSSQSAKFLSLQVSPLLLLDCSQPKNRN